MRTAKFVKVALLTLLLPLVFMGGVIVGNVYDVTDFLCPAKAEPFILEQDFTSKSGILIPKGTVIALRRCAYMQRFNYRFAIDNAAEVPPYTDRVEGSYGFAELYPKTE